MRQLWAAAFAAMAVQFLAASPRVFAAGRVLFVLDSSGSMGLISADGRTRFEHAKDQVRDQSAQYGAQGYEMGMFIFSHRFGGCDDIELKVPMSSSAWGAESSIQDALAGLRPRGATPLTKTIKEAAQYIKDNHLNGTEIVVVSDGGDTCGGDAIQAAKDLYDQTQSKISIIGMDMRGRDLTEMEGVARAGNGTFRVENTGTLGGDSGGASQRIQPGASSALPRSRGTFRAPSPGVYSRGRISPQPATADSQGHRREGAPDDSQPIIDPNSVPKEVSFDPHATPPEAPKMPLTPPPPPPAAPQQEPPQRPLPPAPKPKPTEAPPELPVSTPMLL